MKYTKQSVKIQTLATGEDLQIQAYVFTGTTPGPHIYMQANLHGPEIFGVPLLGKFLNYLEKKENITGTVTVVPCANPVGVQSVGYNAIMGRWNPVTGKNWNRIFTTDQTFQTFQEQKKYYEDILKKENISLEEKLACSLKILSFDATHIIDIHTTGYQSVNHVFTHKEGLSSFHGLDAEAYIVWERKYALGAFDESCVFPFQDTQKTSTPKACTWEVSHHSTIHTDIFEQRYNQLIQCIENIWKKDESRVLLEKIFSITSAQELFSAKGGYLIWRVKPGVSVKKGDVYAELYELKSNTFLSQKAEKDFLLLSTYGIGAVTSGSPIAWVVLK